MKAPLEQRAADCAGGGGAGSGMNTAGEVRLERVGSRGRKEVARGGIRVEQVLEGSPPRGAWSVAVPTLQCNPAPQAGAP